MRVLLVRNMETLVPTMASWCTDPPLWKRRITNDPCLMLRVAGENERSPISKTITFAAGRSDPQATKVIVAVAAATITHRWLMEP